MGWTITKHYKYPATDECFSELSSVNLVWFCVSQKDTNIKEHTASTSNSKLYINVFSLRININAHHARTKVLAWSSCSFLLRVTGFYIVCEPQENSFGISCLNLTENRGHILCTYKHGHPNNTVHCTRGPIHCACGVFANVNSIKA